MPRARLIGLPLAFALMAEPGAAAVGCERASGAAATIAAIEAGRADFVLAAHRACWDKNLRTGGVPENSLLALETCKALGVEIAEIDIRLSRDGRLMVFHDAALMRMTSRQGLVGDFDMSVLTGFRLEQGDGAGRAKRTRQRIPTFTQALEIAGDRLVLAIDAKEDAIRHLALEEARRIGAIDRIFFILPAGPEFLAEAEALVASGAKVRLTVSPDHWRSGAEAIAAVARLDPIAVAISRKDPSFFKAAVEEARSRGISIWVSTFGSEDDNGEGWDRAVSMGAQILQIDGVREAAAHRAIRDGCAGKK